jgi:hypothetical protein
MKGNDCSPPHPGRVDEKNYRPMAAIYVKKISDRHANSSTLPGRTLSLRPGRGASVIILQ